MGRARVVGNRFEIIELAGAGGAASVYRARDRQTDRAVALKLLRARFAPEALGRFSREAEILASLSHEGIVRYVAHGQDDDDVYLAMEWLDGMTLADRLRAGRLTIPEAVALARSLSEALFVAHAAGIIHRDVKPANIFLVAGDPSRAKLLDFGIARLRSSGSDLTLAGMVVGTPAYMAPEQARGERHLSPRADVFSLGCVLFRCLTGQQPFSGNNVVAVLAKVLLETPSRASALRPEVPPALDYLVARLLSKDPDHRPSDAGAIIEALSGLDLPGEDEPTTVALGSMLTTDERRVTCVLLAHRPDDPSDERLRAAVAAQGGRLEVLVDRSILVTVDGTGAPTDHAARAARCALALGALAPGLPMVIAAGEAEMQGTLAVGPVIDRAAALLGGVAGGVIRLDGMIAGLLDASFVVRRDQKGHVLVQERETPSMTRTFLVERPSCVGRDHDLAMLGVAFEQCVEESAARIVLITGPAGIGKSRLLEEFLERVRNDREVAIWIGRGDPMRARSPFGMIAAPLRHAAAIQAGEPAAERQRKLAARVESAVAPADAPRITEFMAELIGAPVVDAPSRELRAARGDPQLMGDQLRRALEDWLEAEAEKRPLIVVLEDLHWGDLPSIKLIDAAARHLVRHPFLVLALARPDVYESFPNIWRERSLTELRLGRLSDRAAARLLREALGERADEQTVAHLVARGDGNPFFLEELVRSVLEDGEALPGTVIAMVQARIGTLSIEARRLLRAASIFGRIFAIEGAFALLGADPLTARSALLDELVAKDFLERSVDARFAGQLAFRHAIIHEAAYAMLTEADRAVGHRLAAEWLERWGESDPIVLAEHFERGGELSRAAGWYGCAATQALEGNDHEAAIERVAQALRCGVSGEEEGKLRLVESEARRWRGDNEGSRRAARMAMGCLARGSAGWCSAASELALVSGSLGETPALVALAEELETVDPLGDGSELVSALARVARPLFWAGQHALASRALARASRLAHPDMQPTALASLHVARGVEARLLGDPAQCVRANQRAMAHSELAGDLRGAAVARGNVGYALLEVGVFTEAERYLGEALAAAERLGLPLVIAIAQQNLGLAHGRRGSFEEARALELASCATFEAQGDRRRAGYSLLYLAIIEIAAERLDAAAHAADRALEALATTPPLRCNALAVRAEIALRRGEDGLAMAREAYTRLCELGSLDEGESRVRLVYAESLLAAGDLARGRQAIAEAEARLMARAARIESETTRATFLALPENARTLELSQALLGR